MLISEEELPIHPFLFFDTGLQGQLRVIHCILLPLPVTFRKESLFERTVEVYHLVVDEGRLSWLRKLRLRKHIFITSAVPLKLHGMMLLMSIS